MIKIKENRNFLDREKTVEKIIKKIEEGVKEVKKVSLDGYIGGKRCVVALYVKLKSKKHNIKESGEEKIFYELKYNPNEVVFKIREIAENMKNVNEDSLETYNRPCERNYLSGDMKLHDKDYYIIDISIS